MSDDIFFSSSLQPIEAQGIQALRRLERQLLDAVNASRSSAEALVLTDEGELADDWHSEPADLSSEAAFRAQVAEWIEATR